MSEKDYAGRNCGALHGSFISHLGCNVDPLFCILGCNYEGPLSCILGCNRSKVINRVTSAISIYWGRNVERSISFVSNLFSFRIKCLEITSESVLEPKVPFHTCQLVSMM